MCSPTAPPSWKPSSPAIAKLLTREDTLASSQLALLVGTDRRVEADVLPGSLAGTPFPLPGLIEATEKQGEASAIVPLLGGLYQVLVVPVEHPSRLAWIVLGFSIDDEDTRLLHELAGLDVSCLTRSKDADWEVVTSTLSNDLSSALVARFDAKPMERSPEPTTWMTADDEYLTMVLLLESYGGQQTVTVIQRSLHAYMQPFRILERELLEFAGLSMLVAILCCIFVARGIVRPVKTLPTFARRIAGGEYGERLQIEGRDEMRDGITEREKKILDLAYRDGLTGLSTRTLLGHPGGDALLIEFASHLKEVFKRSSDTIARMGGDEFTVVMPTEGQDDALMLVLALLTNLEEPFMYDGHLVDIRASIGTAAYPDHGDALETVSRNAESAMHVAKRDKTGYSIYDPQCERVSVERLSLMSELRHAVEHDEFVLFFQPKREIRDSSALSVEALIR